MPIFISNFGRYVLSIIIILIVVSATALYDFLLFHIIAEFISIIIGVLVFILVTNSRRHLDNSFFLLLGVAYLYVAILDFFHTLSYFGMGIITGHGASLPTQLWLIARFTESLSILIALRLFHRRLNYSVLHLAYAAVTGLLLADVFYFGYFPAAFIQGSGLTAFKIYSEYAIVAILFVALTSLYAKRRFFDRRVFFYLHYSIIATILGELVFTLYTDVYGLFNVIGHLFKIISFYLIYLAIVKTGLTDPRRLFYKKLADSEERLKESEERYRSLIELSPDAIIVHSNGRIRFANPAAAALFALKRAELDGQKMIDYIDPGFHSLIEDKFAGSLAGTAKAPRAQIRIKSADGRFIFVEVVSKAITYRGQEAVQMIMHDITKRMEDEHRLKQHARRLEELTREIFKFQLAVEDASDAITITDDRGIIVYANQAAEIKTGYTDKEIIGQTSRLWDCRLLADKDNSVLERRTPWDLLKSGQSSFNGEVMNRSKNSREYLSALSISPVYSAEPKVIYYVCIERDITRLKEIENAKLEFVYFVSHQLKNPLAGIRLLIELLFKGLAGEFTSGQKNYLADIAGSAEKMSKLIETLLQMSRLELGTFPIEPEPMDLAIQFNMLFDSLRLQADKKSIKMTKNIPAGLPVILMDLNAFNLIFENLVTNAIRYTKNGGTITAAAELAGGEIIVKISDTGRGIPAGVGDKIFKKLFRANNARQSDMEGTGLGLYIVKTLADMIGARVWYESHEGAGTTFFIALPLDKFQAN